MKRLNCVISLIFLILLTSCVSVNAVKLDPNTKLPPVPPDQVVIYRTADQVPGKYIEIALLHATGDSLWTNEEQMYNSLRKKAGKLGANGIILDAMSEPSAGAKIAGAFLGISAQRKGKAVAIYVYKDEEKK
jgi:hypothetical protein